MNSSAFQLLNVIVYFTPVPACSRFVVAVSVFTIVGVSPSSSTPLPFVSPSNTPSIYISILSFGTLLSTIPCVNVLFV